MHSKTVDKVAPKPLVKRCCCCYDLMTGSRAIAILYLVFSITGTIITMSTLIFFSEQYRVAPKCYDTEENKLDKILRQQEELKKQLQQLKGYIESVYEKVVRSMSHSFLSSSNSNAISTQHDYGYYCPNQIRSRHSVMAVNVLPFVFEVVNIGTSVMVLLALKKNRPKFLLPWIIQSVIFLLVMLGVAIWLLLLAYAYTVGIAFAVVLFCVPIIYFVIVVISCYQKMCSNETNENNEINDAENPTTFTSIPLRSTDHSEDHYMATAPIYDKVLPPIPTKPKLKWIR